jgi:hypothetical protein
MLVASALEAHSRDPSGGADTCITDAARRQFGIQEVANCKTCILYSCFRPRDLTSPPVSGSAEPKKLPAHIIESVISIYAAFGAIRPFDGNYFTT